MPNLHILSFALDSKRREKKDRFGCQCLNLGQETSWRQGLGQARRPRCKKREMEESRNRILGRQGELSDQRWEWFKEEYCCCVQHAKRKALLSCNST